MIFVWQSGTGKVDMWVAIESVIILKASPHWTEILLQGWLLAVFMTINY